MDTGRISNSPHRGVGSDHREYNNYLRKYKREYTMQYLFCDDDNFEDYASGRVLYHKPGLTNFPVRLLQEIFGRCLSYSSIKHDICLYDGCCGGGYLLTVLGLLNMNIISSIVGSDINLEAIDTAKQNVGLLSVDGIKKRLAEINELYVQYRKESHKDAIYSAEKFKDIVKHAPKLPTTKIFQADIMNPSSLIDKDFKADIVISDVPYGNLVSWQGESQPNLSNMIDNLKPILHENSIVAICSDKKAKIQTERFARIDKQIVGKRKFEIFQFKGVMPKV